MKLSILLSSAVVILGAVSASARLGQYGSADVKPADRDAGRGAGDPEDAPGGGGPVLDVGLGCTRSAELECRRSGHRCKGGVCVPSCDRRDRPWCDRGDPGAVCCGFSWSDCQSQCSRDETEESGGFLTENWASFGTD